MLNVGVSTGSCAALAAKAAALLLLEQQHVDATEIPLPDGSRLAWPIAEVKQTEEGAMATVIKNAGDDPDVTHGAQIQVHIAPNTQNEIIFKAGEGVGTVTLPGLALAVGEAAINPVPRSMICAALREVTPMGFEVTVSVPGGCELAQKTFNPKLGIKGGISIIGTTGRVRPFSAEALRDSLKCTLAICVAAGTRAPVLTPGNIGYRAAHRYFRLDEQQVVEVSNEWGFMLEQALPHRFEELLLIGHPGKLAKLANRQWQTHSAQSDSALAFVTDLASQLLQRPIEMGTTIEGLFMHELHEEERQPVAQALAKAINEAIQVTFNPSWRSAVVLINLKGEILGSEGALERWQ
jgi:cobalt-precorrin-5B (C1)-methyltransferase